MRNLGFDAEPPRLRAEGLTVAIRRGRKRPDGTEALVMLVTSSPLARLASMYSA